MKWIPILLIFFTFPIVTVAASPMGGPLSFQDHLMDVPKKEGSHINVWIPGLLIRQMGKVALKEANERRILSLMPGNTHIKVLTGNKMTPARMTPSIRRYKKRLSRGSYLELAGLRTGSRNIGIAMKRKRNGNIKFMILIHDKDTFAFLKSKTRFSPQELVSLLQRFS